MFWFLIGRHDSSHEKALFSLRVTFHILIITMIPYDNKVGDDDDSLFSSSNVHIIFSAASWRFADHRGLVFPCVLKDYKN